MSEDAYVEGKPAWNRRVSTEQVVTAYRETGSIWKAAKRLGVSGQSVHERLRAMDYPIGGRRWTDDEMAELASLMGNELTIGEVAKRLGRTYAAVACKASELGVQGTQRKRRKIPRGAGFDKVSIGRHLKALESSDLKVTQYARSVGLHVDTLVYACQRHFPDRWAAYVATHSDIPSKQCEYCETDFVPSNGKQRYCTRQCGTRANTDRTYFGGKRATTVGLVEGICQLCGKKDVPGLSSHHVIGKENDQENDILVALCRGCHQIVTLLGGRSFVDNGAAWESLIALAWMRRHGDELGPGSRLRYIETEVRIEVYDADDEAAA